MVSTCIYPYVNPLYLPNALQVCGRSGSLAEVGPVPLRAASTKHAATVHATDRIAADVANAVETALTPHRGPVFLDFPLDVVFGMAEVEVPGAEIGRATSELQSLMRISYAVFCLKKKKTMYLE